MKKHITALLVLIMVLTLAPIQAEAATKLTANVKVETAKTSSASAGTIRYVDQNPGGKYFYSTYWGNNKSVASIQCNLASISMALSYTGINKLPAKMTPFSSPASIISGTGASLKKPSSVSAGIDRMLSGNGKYSPVVIRVVPYLYSSEHWVAVVDRISDNTYYVVDPTYGNGDNAYYKVKIKGNTLSAWGHSSTISNIYQFYNPAGCIKPELTMKFNTNGGKVSSSTYSMSDAGAILQDGKTFTRKWLYGFASENGLPNASTIGMSREGCTFKGWSRSKDGSTGVFGQDEIVKSQDIYPALKDGSKTVTLYAIWKLKTPEVTVSTRQDTGKPRLTWKSVPNASEYVVYRATAKDGTYTKMYTTTSTSYTNTSAKVGTKYYYKVRAVSAQSGIFNSNCSAIKAVTCDCARPVLSIELKSETGKPRLTWEAISGATGYDIYRATSENGTYTKIYTASSTRLTNTSAKAGTRYYYKIRAVIDGVTAASSAYSNVVNIRAK